MLDLFNTPIRLHEVAMANERSPGQKEEQLPLDA